MKKSLLYMIPLLPMMVLYGLVAISGHNKEKNEDLGKKVKVLEEKLSSYTKSKDTSSNRKPANTLPQIQLTRQQVEHLVRFKGCKVFSKEGQNILACPDQRKHQKRFI